MLSYQHIYHAGNAADLHKHALMAWMLDYLTAKPKPLSYFETHAGRGLYHLKSDAARKTAEADSGINRVLRDGELDQDHPLMVALDAVRWEFGEDAYPGSPLLARHFLREDDKIHLAELHPAEFEALSEVGGFAKLHRRDGFEMTHALTPPMPRRGMMLIDPSYELKDEYAEMPRHVARIAGRWNVGVIALWYPILSEPRHIPMLNQLRQNHPDAVRSEVHFAPPRPGHGMIGSGMFVLNPPWGLADEAERIEQLFKSF